MKTTATNRKLRVLLHAISDGSLIPRPDFQRRLVWSNKHKNAFIRTVLEGLPFPEIYVAAGEVDETTAAGIELLVDGQQRLTTLDQYFRGSKELKLEKDLKPYIELKDKLNFLEYEVVVRDLGAVPIDEIKEVFKRINSTSYSLNAMEINNARFDGELKNYCFDLAQHPFFEKYNVFSATDGRRMNDVRFILSIVITLLSTYFNRDELFEEYLQQYDDEFSFKEQISDEINFILNLIDQCNFIKSSRAFKKSDLFSLIVELHRLIYKQKMTIVPENLCLILNAFYEKVESVNHHEEYEASISEYYKAALQASNDRGNRIKRGDILKKFITENYK
jgi:hypothetical protein